MRAFFAIRSAEQLLRPSKELFAVSRTKIYFPAKFFSCQPKSADSWIDGPLGSKVVHTTLLAAAKEEAKVLLTLFLKKQGLSNAVAAKTIKKSDLFIDHLVSRAHCVHKSQNLAGRELTTLEIRSTIIPYLEALLKEHGNLTVDVVESFPSPPVKEENVGSVCQPNATLVSRKLKVMSRISEIDPDGKLSPQVLYLMELGMDLEQIKGIIKKYPPFAHYSLKGKIKPLVEFLFDLGISKSKISTILYRMPRLCGYSLSKNLIPSMIFLESLGLDKKKWAEVIYRCPSLICYSKQKVETIVGFLHEMGLSADSIGKTLTCYPNIIGCNVMTKLHPTARYFNSLGADVAGILRRYPRTFSLNLEDNLKPKTEFFLERGFSSEEIGIILSKFSNLYALSVSKNLIPKWEFFLTMGYSKSVLVQFPHYFGYSLEGRIKPRYSRVKENGVAFNFHELFSLTNRDFEKVLKRKMERRVACKEMSCSRDDIC